MNKLQPITNYVVFPKVMENPKICGEFLKMILPKDEYPDLDHLTEENIIVEKDFVSVCFRDIRLDVYIHTDVRRIDLEMQKYQKEEYSLPERTRMHHIIMGHDQLSKGDSFKKLKPTTVIFLCMFDYFGDNLPRNTFRMQSEEHPGLHLNDGTCTILLNLTYSGDLLSDETNALYAYFREGVLTSEDGLVADLHHEVEKVNADEGGFIMTLEEHMEAEIEFRVKEQLEEKAKVLAEEKAKVLAEEKAKALAEEKAKALAEEQVKANIIKNIHNFSKKGFSAEEIAEIIECDLSFVNAALSLD